MVKDSIDMKTVKQQALDIQKNGSNETKCGEGVALIKNLAMGTTSKGASKYTGIIANGEETRFNVFNNTAAYDFIKEHTLIPGESVVKISYTISKYGLCIETMQPVEGYNPDDFLEHRYEIHEMSKRFRQALDNSGATERAHNVISKVLHGEEKDEINARIAREYAALSHHDNCRTGLLAHMTKCIELYNGIKVPYEFLLDERTNDLMVIALAIHDIGKIQEMYNGTYQKYSYLSHRILGIQYFMDYKQLIVEEYNEDFFQMLCSVLQQHHDEYGDLARTLYAYLVHMIDNMEATFTSIDEMMRNKEYVTDDSGTKLKYNDRYLNIFTEQLTL